MVKQVDTPDLKSCDQQWSCGFDSRSEYVKLRSIGTVSGDLQSNAVTE